MLLAPAQTILPHLALAKQLWRRQGTVSLLGNGLLSAHKTARRTTPASGELHTKGSSAHSAHGDRNGAPLQPQTGRDTQLAYSVPKQGPGTH